MMACDFQKETNVCTTYRLSAGHTHQLHLKRLTPQHADPALIVLWGLTKSLYVPQLSRCDPPFVQDAPIISWAIRNIAHLLEICTAPIRAYHTPLPHHCRICNGHCICYAEATAAVALYGTLMEGPLAFQKFRDIKSLWVQRTTLQHIGCTEFRDCQTIVEFVSF